MNEIPRRVQFEKCTPEEHSIRNAILAVEAMGANPHLTDAVVLLGQAQNKVADFVDDIPVTQIPAIGDAFGGGFFAGLYYENGTRMALIVAPKAEGQAPEDLEWGGRGKKTEARSLVDGLANTRALGDAHPAAKFCRDLRIGGHDDWHLPALDQMSVLRANMTPEDDHVPVQTTAEAFKQGGPEAFDTEEAYWTSTECTPGYAWCQAFLNGTQASTPRTGACASAPSANSQFNPSPLPGPLSGPGLWH